MALKPQQRKWILASALLLTLAAVYAVQESDEADTVGAANEQSRRLPAPTSMDRPVPVSQNFATSISPGVRPAALKSLMLPDIRASRKRLVDTGDSSEAAAAVSGESPGGMHPVDAVNADNAHPDLLKAHAWYVAPAPQVVAYVPVEKPVAPPAPFQYMGKLEDSPQGTLIFIAIANKVQSIVPGQLINSSWRLDGEDAQALYLTYLPLGTAQVLPKTAKRAPVSAPADANQPS